MILLNQHLKLDKGDKLNPYIIFRAHTDGKTGDHEWRAVNFFTSKKLAYEGIMRLYKESLTERARTEILGLIKGDK